MMMGFGALLAAASVLAAFGSEVKISTDFPGANVVVEEVKGDTVSVRPDPRDSSGECAPRHWAFRVRGAAGRTLEFVFPKDPIFGHLSTRGPAVSHDGGETWRWMSGGVPENPPDRFAYSFGSAEDDVVFSWQPLYTGATLRRFLDGPGKGKVRLETLCRTDRGRDAELLRFGNEKAPAGVFLAARHHANEIWASYVLEGLLREAVSDSAAGRFLRENASFVVMPFADKDGVEDGDPGKSRRPYDHNRDYHLGRYPTIRSIRPLVKKWVADKRSAYGFDFHSCSLEIRGRRLHDPKAWAHNMLFQIYTGTPQGEFAHRIFARELKKAHDNRTELMQYFGNDGARTGSAKGDLGKCEKWMADELPPGYTATLEAPFAHPDGRPATPEDAYRLGAHLAQALAVLIREDAKHPPLPKAFATDALQTPEMLNPVPPYLQDCERSFQSAPSVTVTRGGRLWLTWHTGGSNEGDDNAVVVASSGDGGRTWSKPLFAFDQPGPMRYLDPGFWTDPDGRVWLFFCQLYGYWDGRGGLWAMHPKDAEDANSKWTAPRRLCDGFMKNKPLVTSDGRWLLPVEFLGAATPRRPEDKPFMFERPDADTAQVYLSSDKGERVTSFSAAPIPHKDISCKEHMIVERKDGTLWMLVRMKYGIGESASQDGGKTWSEVRPSKICNPEARFHLSRLASGALLLVKNGPVDRQLGRSRMMAYVSDDDGASWKGGLVLDERDNVSYPDAAQGVDGTIYIVHDRERTQAKEILFHRVTEADIRAGRVITPGSALKVVANKAGEP